MDKSIDGHRRVELTRNWAQSKMLADLIASGGFKVQIMDAGGSATLHGEVNPHVLLVHAEDEAEIRAALDDFMTQPGNFETVDDIEDLIHDDVEDDVND